MPSEIRKDYIQDKYVIIAPLRGKRPIRTQEKDDKKKAPKTTCFFCPHNIKKEEIIELIGKKKMWDLAVLENKFSAVSIDNPRAYGIQEVIVETPHPTRQLEQLSPRHIAHLLELYANRTKAITANKKIQYVLIFKNNGGHAGASIVHSHSQIFATAFLPPHLRDKTEKVLEYRLRHGTCVYCDVIRQERESQRFVAERDGVIAFTPFASLHNYELWILPVRHIDNVTQLRPKERLAWAHLLKAALGAITKLGLPYNFYFHEVVYDENQHLYMKITPRGSVWAGVEIGSGLIINAISPEEAATYYRQEFKS
ncbi:MAG: DUF4931 domain-containing protein [bacterium]|nr:DUF4931 domain-containing protein [bacterium]